MQDKRIKSLSNVYIKLGFDEISQKAKVAANVKVEDRLEQMVGSGQMKCKIDRETRTVSFIEDDSMSELVTTLETQNARII